MSQKNQNDTFSQNDKNIRDTERNQRNEQQQGGQRIAQDNQRNGQQQGGQRIAQDTERNQRNEQQSNQRIGQQRSNEGQQDQRNAQNQRKAQPLSSEIYSEMMQKPEQDDFCSYEKEFQELGSKKAEEPRQCDSSQERRLSQNGARDELNEKDKGQFKPGIHKTRPQGIQENMPR